MDESHCRYAEQQKPARGVAPSTPTSGGTGLMGGPMGTQGASYTEQMGDKWVMDTLATLTGLVVTERFHFSTLTELHT